MKKLSVTMIFGAAMLAATPLLAHHSGHAYDSKHPITLTGTVAQYEFTNPHSLVYFDVKEEDGTLTHWMLLTAGPAKLFRAGWNRDSLKPGDVITVTGFPSKDGKKEMGLQKLIPPRGGVVLTEGAD